MAKRYVADGYVAKGYVNAGIWINWGTRVIFVPKGELTLVQSSPVEVRSLDLNEFRKTLKSLEDDPAGMAYPDTHRHIAPINVGGVELARVVEILNGFTITFQDGNYAVNLIGANSNVADRVNVNKVSVRAANSAGLVVAPGSVLTAEAVRQEIDANSTRLFEIDFKADTLLSRLTATRAAFLDRIPKLLTVAKFIGLK